MSGGSYNYLCDAFGLELVDRIDDLGRMGERLRELGFVEAGIVTESVIMSIQAFEQGIDSMSEEIRGVWQALEWYDSNDYALDQVKEADAEFMKPRYPRFLVTNRIARSITSDIGKQWFDIDESSAFAEGQMYGYLNIPGSDS